MLKTILASAALVAGLSGGGQAMAGPIDYRVVDKIAGADGGWDFARVDAAHGVLYVARSNAVMAVDLATRKVSNLASADGGHQVLPIDHGAVLVETDGKSNLTRFIDTVSGKVLAQVPSGIKPDAAFHDDSTGTIVVMSPGDDTITSIDAKTYAVVGKMKLAGGLEYAVGNGHGGAFVNLEDEGRIAEVDLKAGSLLRKIDMPGCTGPTGLAKFASGQRLISACANGVAVVVDVASGKVLANLPIGKDADAVIIDKKRELAFIPCGGNGTLVALDIHDPDHVRVAQVIPTQIGAKTGALDPRDGKLYLPTATLAAPEPGAKRGKPLAGTFIILVVAPQAQTSGVPVAVSAPKAMQYLDPALFQPALLLPAPAAKDSNANARELEALHRLIANAGADRIRQAHDDAINENPAIFNAAIGADLKQLPATWELLEIVHQEANVAANLAKNHFQRMRPYSADLTIPFCEGKADPAKPAYRSYPSGHATLGYSVGVTLARLMPAKAGAILARAQDYALSREVCGAHYASDTQASEVIGTLAATLLLSDPRLADKVAAAKAELARY
jgi:hypothetical protein